MFKEEEEEKKKKVLLSQTHNVGTLYSTPKLHTPYVMGLWPNKLVKKIKNPLNVSHLRFYSFCSHFVLRLMEAFFGLCPTFVVDVE